MRIDELEDFLDHYGITDQEFSNIIGITKPALDHWLTGRRRIPPTAAKLIKFFNKHPEMMKEF